MSMETYNFELRIFANLAGFAEIKFGNSDTLSAKVLNEGVLDGKRGMFKAGTFVIFYDEAVYVLVKLVDASGAGYRDSGAYVCVAVRRGYRLNNAKQVMDRLEEEFLKWVSQYKLNVATALSSGKAELEQMVNVNIERDDDQPVYPVLARQQAIVSYGKQEELKDLLDHPFREQFAELRALYILSQEEAGEKWPGLKGSFKAITDLSYPYQRTYRLCYPDEQEETITGLDQEVKRVCVKLRCASLTFEGKLKDHMEDWKITLNPEKTIYTIGLEFEPEQKKYTVVTKDEKGNSYKGMIYKASLGIIQDDTLTLKGEEIDNFESQRSVLTLQGRSDLEIVEQKVLEAQIEVTVKQLYKYDVSTLWGTVESTVGHKQSISIALVNANTHKVVFDFSEENLSAYLDLPYDQAYYKVGETNKYEACPVSLKSDGTSGEYKPKEIKQGILPKASDKQEKKKLKVTIRIENPRLRQELDWEEKKVRLDLKYRALYGEEKEDSISITQSPYSFEVPSNVSLELMLKAKGYKKCMIKKDYIYKDKPKEGNEDVIDVTFKKFPYKKIAVLVVCLLVGFALGFWIEKIQVKDVDGKQYVEFAEYKELKVENDGLKQANDKLSEENENLKRLLDPEPKDPNEGGGPSDVIDQQRKELINKLEGIKFTRTDVEKFKQLYPDEKKSDLIKDCEACLYLLFNIDRKKKKVASRHINENTPGEYLSKYNEIKNSVHKDAINKIFLGDYRRASASVPIDAAKCKSITDVLEVYEKNSSDE